MGRTAVAALRPSAGESRPNSDVPSSLSRANGRGCECGRLRRARRREVCPSCSRRIPQRKRLWTRTCWTILPGLCFHLVGGRSLRQAAIGRRFWCRRESAQGVGDETSICVFHVGVSCRVLTSVGQAGSSAGRDRQSDRNCVRPTRCGCAGRQSDGHERRDANLEYNHDASRRLV